MPLANNQIYQVKFTHWTQGQLGLNVRYYQVFNVVGDSVSVQEAADQMSNSYAPVIKPCMSSEAEYLGLSLKKIFPLPVELGVISDDGAGFGLSSAVLLPTQVAGIITLRSALAGRENRGRVYVPFPSGDDLDAATGDPTAGYIANLADLGDFFRDELTFTVGANSAQFRPVIAGPDGQVRAPIIEFTARSRFATQRRRGQYGAKNPREIAL